jgi:hypothetical protein
MIMSTIMNSVEGGVRTRDGEEEVVLGLENRQEGDAGSPSPKKVDTGALV